MTDRYRILFGFSAVLALASCQDKDFLNIENLKERMPLLGCRCPGGFTANPGQDGCTRESKVDPSGGSIGRMIELGDESSSYLSEIFYFTDADATTDWPIAFEPRTSTVDHSGRPLPETVVASIPFWVDRVFGKDKISIKSHPGLWHTKTVCIDIQREKSYTIHIGGDNNWGLKIDGLEYGSCTRSYCFVNGRFISQTLKSGKHLVEMKYYNYPQSSGALWYEIYDQPMAEVQAATKESDLSILFTTKSLVGQYWDFAGEICPPGYAYDVCAGDNKCTKLEKAACL